MKKTDLEKLKGSFYIYSNGEYVVLMDIAKREELSEKYLEGILASLSHAGFVKALRGRGGGGFPAGKKWKQVASIFLYNRQFIR